jgi:DNA-binding SARP family transcriptional activator/tetratricopeptide (TPR) repeat protein
LLSVRLLGEQCIDGAGARTDRHSSRALALLGMLALHADAPQPRQHLAGLLWPDSTEAQARTNLRRELHYLRLMLGDDTSLVVGSTTLMWRDRPTCRVDVRAFAREREQALAAAPAGDRDLMLSHAAAAVAEYRGDLMPGVYDEWVHPEREQLRQQCVDLCDRLASGFRDDGDLGRACEFARMRVRLEPLEELGYRTLMELQGYVGDRAGAISTFHTCAEVLERELGVKPSAATTALADQLLRSAESGQPTIPSNQWARLQASRPTAIVGRQPELDRMLGCWRQAVAGRPGLLVVAGEAGVGKSRLVAEFGRMVEASRATVATTRCFSAAGRLALAPVGDWLRSPRFRRAVSGLDQVWRIEVERLIPSAVDDTATDGGRVRLRPEPIPVSRAMVDAWRRHRFFEGLAMAVLAVGEPTLLVLDDLQWCDEETAVWLGFLLNLAPVAPLLVTATVRSEEVGENVEVSRLLRAWKSAGLVTEVDLQPLGRDSVGELGSALLGRRLSAEELSLLTTATGGYPLYVIEALRSARDSGEAASLTSLADITSVLRHRLDQASAEAKEIAGLAAAVGRDFSLDLISEASDLEADTVIRSVDELWRHRIIREQGTGYDFTHDLVRDAAYASVSPPRRWLQHRRLAQAFELLYAGREDDVAAQLAEQYERAGRPDRARRYYRRAAELAAAVFANSEAVRCFRHCLALVSAQPAGRARDVEELDLLLATAPPLNAIHGYSSPMLQETLERAADLAEKLARPRDLMGCVFALVGVRFVQGHIRDAYELATRVFDLIEAAPEAAGSAHLAVAGTLTSLGRPAEAIGHFDRARELSRGSESLLIGTMPEIHALAWSSHAHWLLGNSEHAVATCQEAVDLARSANRPYSLALALGYAATTQQLVGYRPAAQVAATELIELCERYGFGFYGEWGRVVDGWLLGGEVGAARVRNAIDTLRTAGQLARMPYWLSLLADVTQQAGRFDAARAILDAACAEAEQRDERWWLPEVLRVRAGLLDADAAVPMLRRAALLAQHQHSRTIQARCEADLASYGVVLDDHLERTDQSVLPRPG